MIILLWRAEICDMLYTYYVVRILILNSWNYTTFSLKWLTLAISSCIRLFARWIVIKTYVIWCWPKRYGVCEMQKNGGVKFYHVSRCRPPCSICGKVGPYCLHDDMQNGNGVHLSCFLLFRWLYGTEGTLSTQLQEEEKFPLPTTFMYNKNSVYSNVVTRQIIPRSWQSLSSFSIVRTKNDQLLGIINKQQI